MKIRTYLRLSREVQYLEARAAIDYRVDPEWKTDCRIAIDNDHRLFVQFVRLIPPLLNAGYEHFGGRSLLETLRYETSAQGSDPTFKCNNNLAAPFTRLALALFKDELVINGKPFFECRERPNKGAAA